MPSIKSRENPLIKETAALVRRRRDREERGLFVAEGARLCAEAAGTVVVRQVFYTPGAAEKYADYCEKLFAAAAQRYEITPEVAQKLSDTQSPQGVFCVCEMPKPPAFLREGPLPDGRYILLAGLQDPGNVGTILRACEALGAAGVFLCGAVELWSPKLLRATMGSLFRLPVLSAPRAEPVLSVLKTRGCRAYGAAPDARAKPLPQVCFAAKSVVLIGNEGAGLSPELLEACDETVVIPMPGRAESLNAASAAAILLYQMSL